MPEPVKSYYCRCWWGGAVPDSGHFVEQLRKEWQVGYRTIVFQLTIVTAAFFQQKGEDRVFKLGRCYCGLVNRQRAVTVRLRLLPQGTCYLGFVPPAVDVALSASRTLDAVKRSVKRGVDIVTHLMVPTHSIATIQKMPNRVYKQYLFTSYCSRTRPIA